MATAVANKDGSYTVLQYDDPNKVNQNFGADSTTATDNNMNSFIKNNVGNGLSQDQADYLNLLQSSGKAADINKAHTEFLNYLDPANVIKQQQAVVDANTKRAGDLLSALKNQQTFQDSNKGNVDANNNPDNSWQSSPYYTSLQTQIKGLQQPTQIPGLNVVPLSSLNHQPAITTQQTTSFNSPQEADSSGLPAGTIVIVQGRKYQI